MECTCLGGGRSRTFALVSMSVEEREREKGIDTLGSLSW